MALAPLVHKIPIQSTAGAIPVKNEKGEWLMEKVKVARYVTGKRPDYAPEYSSDEEADMDVGMAQQRRAGLPDPATELDTTDRRLQRLQARRLDDGDEPASSTRVARHRRLQEPEVLGNSDDDGESEEEEGELDRDDDDTSEEEELADDEIERRRTALRHKVRAQKEEEVLDKEEEKPEEGSAGEESSEYEEYTDSEEDETGPRLKPVFVRKKDRITIIEKEKEEEKEREKEVCERKAGEERRRATLRLVEEDAKREAELRQMNKDEGDINDVVTDDENEFNEEEYESWKVRELKRIKREREERDTAEKEKAEIERLRNLTEEERKAELKANPKEVTNKAQKGKYKFLQKYYHRGVFFLDEEDQVYQRDFAQPTLEDHFDKTILPKVMQVKNFGRSGRTKYTHLVDQDTTHFDSPWTDTATSLKFHNNKGGGMKQVFDRPSAKMKTT